MPLASHSYSVLFALFFFNDPAPPDIYTLSLHDALPISPRALGELSHSLLNLAECDGSAAYPQFTARRGDRKSTRLNSSHGKIWYAVFCLKKKNGAVTALKLAARLSQAAALSEFPAPHSG